MTQNPTFYSKSELNSITLEFIFIIYKPPSNNRYTDTHLITNDGCQ